MASQALAQFTFEAPCFHTIRYAIDDPTGATHTISLMIYGDGSTPTQGFEMAMFPEILVPVSAPQVLEVTDVTPGVFGALGGPEFFLVNLDNTTDGGRGFSLGCVIDSMVEYVFSTEGIVVAEVSMQVTESALSPTVPNGLVVGLFDFTGQGGVGNAVSINGGADDVTPTLIEGTFVVRPFADFTRGDANNSNSVTISDPIFLLNYLFLGGPAPLCPKAADADDDGTPLDLGDVIANLQIQFSGVPPIEPTSCGQDPTPYDGLSCDDTGCNFP